MRIDLVLVRTALAALIAASALGTIPPAGAQGMTEAGPATGPAGAAKRARDAREEAEHAAAWVAPKHPGFMLQPGEKILVVSGVPGKKSHGEPPAREGMRTYHLFQHDGLLTGAGTTIKLAMTKLRDEGRIELFRGGRHAIWKKCREA